MQGNALNGKWVDVVGTVEGALDDQGNWFPLGSCRVTPGFDTSGNQTTDTAQYLGNTWIRTYTYTNGVLTDTGLWVKQ